jgi:hypothetical protein
MTDLRAYHFRDATKVIKGGQRRMDIELRLKTLVRYETVA